MEKKTDIEKTDAKTAKQPRKHKIELRNVLPIVGLVFIFALFCVLTEGRMITSANLVFSQVFVLAIASTGVFFIMTMGGLDFSQGSILGMSSIVICTLSEYSVPLAIVGGILTGAAIGAINGYFTVRRKIASFIVTICTMFLFRGVIKYFTTKSPIPCTFDMIFLDTFWLRIGLTTAVLVIAFVIFKFTPLGINLKAIGAGEKAARFAGIRTDRTKFLIYVVAGALTGLAAFLSVIKVGSVTSSAGNQLETQILIALVLGGLPISGGAKVRFQNIVVGSLLYTVLNSGLIMVGVSTQTLQLIEGIIFLAFVAIFADRQALHIIK